MIQEYVSKCPKCGNAMVKAGSVVRVVRVENGEKILVKMLRKHCKMCKTWHRIIPNFIIPYKHYRKDILDGFVSGRLSTDDLSYENGPTELTVRRWLKKKGGE